MINRRSLIKSTAGTLAASALGASKLSKRTLEALVCKESQPSKAGAG